MISPIQPPASLEAVTTDGLAPAIHVEGDILRCSVLRQFSHDIIAVCSKKYDFMMGDLRTNPYKIAQVALKRQQKHELKVSQI